MEQIAAENNVSEAIKVLAIYQTILMLQSLGVLIRKSMAACKSSCAHCQTGAKRKLVSSTRSKKSTNLLFQFRCSTCGKEKTLLKNSFFSIFKSPFNTVLDIIKCWCLQMTQIKTGQYLKINKTKKHRTTIGEIFKRLRNMSSLALNKKHIKLGGKDKIVEIDESLFVKVKYWKGKDLKRKQVWVFGMVCRSSGRCYFQIVQNRKAETLLPIIYDHVLPGK